MNDTAIQERPASTDLVDPKVLTPAAVFGTPGGVDAVLKAITDKARAFKGDMSTAVGRREIASFAHKIARSKTALDEMGKDLAAEWKAKSGAVDAERRTIRERLDALKDEVRKPLDDWEQAEEDRVAAHQRSLAALEDVGLYRENLSVTQIDERLAALATRFAREWQEFSVRATEAEAAVRNGLLSLREATVKRETERAELERLRQEKAEQERKVREEKIAAEAAERAKREAEEKAAREAKAAEERARQEQERIEREKRDAVARAEKAEADAKAAAERAEQEKREAEEKVERERKAAAERAERDRVAAIETERQRAAAAKAAEEAAAAKREADRKHAARINKEAADGLVAACPGLEPRAAMGVIAAIARGDVPHTSIRY